MQKIYNDGTDQEVYFQASKDDYSGEFVGSTNGEALSGAAVVIREYKGTFTTISTPTVTWNATGGYWFVTIPAANITQYGPVLITVSGTGMVSAAIEAVVSRAEDYYASASALATVDTVVDTISTNLSALNNVSEEQILAQATAALNSYDAPTYTEMTAAFTAIKGGTWSATDTLQAIKAGQSSLATSSNLSTANSNILAIKNITDYLTLANVKAQCATAISDAALPASVWNNETRTLTSAGASGATAQEVWEYATRVLTTAPATPTDVNSILTTYGAAKPADVSTAIANASLATASAQTTGNNNIAAIKAITDLLTLSNVKSQVTGALNDAALPSAVWTNTTRTLTSSGTGGGATATEIWSYSDRQLTAVPTGTALASDLSTANTKLDSIKAKTDTIDWSMIKKALLVEIGNYDIPSGGGAGTYTITLSGIGNASFTVDASGNRTLTSITVV